MFSAWVTTSGQAWADFDVFMPGRWEKDWQRRRAARIPGGLGHQTKPQLAIAQLKRLLGAGLPAKWAAYDEVYGRSSELRRFCESRNLAYVAVVPCDFRVTLPSGAVIRADQAVKDAVFERRSCGNGSKGPRFADWALLATSSPRHFLLIRRLISRPDDLTFYLCWAPEDTPATMTFFVTIAGRRWPAEETFKTGKDVLGWDQCQARAWDAVCRHTALAAVAQLRQAAVRNHLCGDITLPPAPSASSDYGRRDDGDVSGSDLGIPLGDAPVPARGGQPCPPRIAAIRLTIAETARIERLARQHAAGLITRARLAFHLRWSRLAAPPPGPRPVAPLQHPAADHGSHLIHGGRKEVTRCNRKPGNHVTIRDTSSPGPRNRDCTTRRPGRPRATRESRPGRR